VRLTASQPASGSQASLLHRTGPPPEQGRGAPMATRLTSVYQPAA
jgi:hypothetical protein